MDRRNFLKRSAQKTVQQVMDSVDARVNERARRWVRPPFALNELDFLLACSRCGACIEVCPAQVIFPLSASLGPDVAGTPALDLAHRACQLCNDWPCVNACEPGALMLPRIDENETIPLPQLASASIDIKACLPYQGPECGACEGSCPIDGALTWDNYQPVIHAERCIGCGLCRQACIMEPKAIHIVARPENPQ
jgi:ferredoxin-type protein NapG